MNRGILPGRTEARRFPPPFPPVPDSGPARSDLRVVQVTSGRFHQFDLARQLERRGLLEAIYTGYPRWKLRAESLPPGRIRPCPWLHVPYRVGLGRGLRTVGLDQLCQNWDQRLIDRYAAWTMPAHTDVLIAMSGHGSASGTRVQARGGAWICVRGSTHVRHQESVLRDEHRRWGLGYAGRPERVMTREEFEYAHADRIAVPSRQVWRTFVACGVPEERLALVPYGVDLGRFDRVGEPAEDEFRIGFVGALTVRKGLGYLIEAFRRVRHPRKRLTLIGAATGDTRVLLRDLPEGVEVLGHRPQAELPAILSRCHVFALCSIEEGLANVMGQALACGCPVIATEATGAADLFSDGVEGFILPDPEPAALAARLEALAQDPARRQGMSEAALQRVRQLGGWDHYGDIMEQLIRTLARKKGKT